MSFTRAMQITANLSPNPSLFRTASSVVPSNFTSWAPLDSVQLSEPELAIPASSNIGSLLQGLQENYGSKLGPVDQFEAREIKSFEERLPTAGKDVFRKLEPVRQLEIARLGEAFPGSLTGSSSLLKLMEDGRLFEEDSSGESPLDRLSGNTRKGGLKGPDHRNFVVRTLDAIENPEKSVDAGRRNAEQAGMAPAEFVRDAVQERESARISGEGSDLERSPLEL